MTTSEKAKSLIKTLKTDRHQSEIWAEKFLAHYVKMAAATPMGQVSEPEFGLLLSMNQYLIECMQIADVKVTAQIFADQNFQLVEADRNKWRSLLEAVLNELPKGIRSEAVEEARNYFYE